MFVVEKNNEMTYQEWKRCLRCGLGRCKFALEASSGYSFRYEKLLLKECGCGLEDPKILGFDPQCEGSKAEYLYQLILCFPKPEKFEVSIRQKFLELQPNGTWLFQRLTDLLCCFARDKNRSAKEVLWKKYHMLLWKLSKGREKEIPVEELEYLCIRLLFLEGLSGFFSIVKDLESFIKEQQEYGMEDFLYFFESACEKYGERQIANEARISLSENSLYKDWALWQTQKKIAVHRKHRIVPTASELIEIVKRRGRISAAQRVRFIRRARKEEKKKLAAAVTTESVLWKKAELLKVFLIRDSELFFDPDVLIGYTKQKNRELKETALNVLERIKAAPVRELALEQLEKKENIDGAILMLIQNFQAEDKGILLSAVQDLPITLSERSGWHEILFAISRISDRELLQRLPGELFEHFYTYGLCSCCRFSLVLTMEVRRALPDWLLKECCYDRSDELRRFARRCLKHRRKRLLHGHKSDL